MIRIDENKLEAALSELEKARHWSPRVVTKLEALVRSEDELALLHINPLSWAKARGIAAQEAIDLFLLASRFGLFRMDWSMVCFGCGFRISSFDTLRQMRSRSRCNVCQTERVVNLDDWIEVSFTISPAVRRIVFHDPDSLPAPEYFRYLAVDGVRFPNGESLPDLAKRLKQICERIAPKSRAEYPLAVGPGMLLGTIASHHDDFAIPVGEGAREATLAIGAGGSSCALVHEKLAAGGQRLVFENSSDKPAFVLVMHIPPTHQWEYAIFEPFLTGGMLLANQTFRRLFRSEVIESSEGIGVRFVTLLFTDLKGSTAMYERIGDMKAFSLVNQHFDRLGAAVSAHGGAVVKTIGDAVMAVFMEPTQAVAAATEMLDAIERFNQEHGAQELILKIGIHSGPSIAVTLNHNLDYFGQTVNLAARVQGLADAEEIWITDAVYQAPGVREQVGSGLTAQEVRLKGIGQDVRVYKLPRAGAQIGALQSSGT
jgi:class 3 adenylate cyclase